MDKKYKIDWCEVKKTGNTNGREWKITEMTLTDEEGKKTDKVSTLENVAPGLELEGKIVTNDKGYLNFVKKLEAPEFVKKAGNSAYKEKLMNETMARKETSITKFQDNKEWSIKISSTMRDAVLLSIAEQNPTADRILAWRRWLWNNWDVDLEDTDAITGKLN
jgi:hypothetical protein